jgi:SET domain-containing protein
MKTIGIPYNESPVNPIEQYTEVGPSKIHGLGLFAKNFIPKGAVWWYARPQDVIIITKEQFLTLDASNKTLLMKNFMQSLLTYSYYDEILDALIFCLDNSRFVNHSFNPNSGTEDEHALNAITKRDIHPGEEITEDFTRYVLSDWLQKYEKYFDPYNWLNEKNNVKER